MTFCFYMDPLNWSFRYYLVKAIEKVGFDNGWGPIIEKVDLLSRTFIGCRFQVTERQCHLFYLQMLAEFGDFRRYSDPLTEPSQEIKDKIEKMRRSELRHELLIANNQIRYNNYILHHHKHAPITCEAMTWKRFPSETPETEKTQNDCFLVKVASAAKTRFDWCRADLFKGTIIQKDVSFDAILTRCINGVISTPMELMRDVFHLIVNLQLSEKQKDAKTHIEAVRRFFLEELRGKLEEDPAWEKVRGIIEGTEE